MKPIFSEIIDSKNLMSEKKGLVVEILHINGINVGGCFGGRRWSLPEIMTSTKITAASSRGISSVGSLIQQSVKVFK